MPRDELRATLEARRELGEEFEPELVERFAQQLERRLEERAGKPVRTERGPETGVSIVSLLVSIPMLGIAGGTAGLAGVIAVCFALVLVNYVVWRRV